MLNESIALNLKRVQLQPQSWPVSGALPRNPATPERRRPAAWVKLVPKPSPESKQPNTFGSSEVFPDACQVEKSLLQPFEVNTGQQEDAVNAPVALPLHYSLGSFFLPLGRSFGNPRGKARRGSGGSGTKQIAVKQIRLRRLRSQF